MLDILYRPPELSPQSRLVWQVIPLIADISVLNKEPASEEPDLLVSTPAKSGDEESSEAPKKEFAKLFVKSANIGTRSGGDCW